MTNLIFAKEIFELSISALKRQSKTEVKILKDEIASQWSIISSSISPLSELVTWLQHPLLSIGEDENTPLLHCREGSIKGDGNTLDMEMAMGMKMLSDLTETPDGEGPSRHLVALMKKIVLQDRGQVLHLR